MSEKYLIKLGQRVEMINGKEKQLWHIVSPEISSGRIKPGLWQSFLKYIKSSYTHRLNWNLYEGVPVYEYQCTSEDLKYTINYFLESKKVMSKNEIVFELFEYNGATIQEVPEDYSQHLSL